MSIRRLDQKDRAANSVGMLERSAKTAGESAQSLGSMGAGCGIFFGLFFAGIGVVFISVLVTMLAEEVKPYFWERVPCQVEACEIAVDDLKSAPFQLQVRYSYLIAGNSYTSDQYTVSDHRESDYEKLALERARILKGRDEVFCYVDPESPSTAVLKRGKIWFALFGVVPLIFTGAGLVLVFVSVSSIRKSKAVEQSSESVPLSSYKRRGGMGLVLFGAVFFLTGAGFFLYMFVVPLKRYVDSGDWIETECKIIWSKVKAHRGDDSTTYSVDIFYEYEWQGQLYRSTRFNALSGWSSSGRSGKQKVVAQYPAGSSHNCQVNPEIPEQAILNRDLAGIWMGLLPLIFVIVGVSVMGFGFKTMWKRRPDSGLYRTDVGRSGKVPQRERYYQGAGETAKFTVRPDGAVEFRSGKSRWKTVLGTLFFGLFWNGIVGVFVYQLAAGWMSGRGEWLPTLFMVPFVIIGLSIVVFFAYALLQAFNPQVVITLAADRVRLGSALKVHWKSSGSMRRLRSLRILVRGAEKATYRRGTDTVTDDSVFFQQEIARTTHLLEMMNGSGEVSIPEDLMFSFGTDNNQIIWEIVIEGDIPNWPDISDRYTIEMLPPEHYGKLT